MSPIAAPTRLAAALPGRLDRAAMGAATAAERVPTWEVLFAALGLLLSFDAGVFASRLLSGTTDPNTADYLGGDPIAQAIWFCIYLGSLGLLLARPSLDLRALRQAGPAWGLLGLAVLSMLWSGAAEVTLRRLLGLVGSSLFGAYLGLRYSWDDMLDLILWASAIGFVASLLVILVLPDYGITSALEGGAWRGMFAHKNFLGRLASFSFVLWLIRLFDGTLPRIVAAGFAALALFMLVRSTAATGIVLCATLVLFLGLSRIWRLRADRAVLALMVLTVGGAGVLMWLSANVDAALGLLNKDETLSGRTELWGLVLDMIADRPLLGYGYGGFWLGWDGPSAHIWLAVTQWRPPNAHNGFLDLGLELGLAGVAIFVAALLSAFGQALRLLRHYQALSAAFPLLLLVYLTSSSLSESYLFVHNSFLWIAFVAVFVQLGPIGRRDPTTSNTAVNGVP